jgi:ribonucleoside-triphosphate reductase
MEGTMIQVIQKDGKVMDFTLTKISDAIIKAFMAADMQDKDDVADLLALRVTADFQACVTENGIRAEDIQSSVGRVLAQAGYEEAAKAYLLRDISMAV